MDSSSRFGIIGMGLTLLVVTMTFTATPAIAIPEDVTAIEISNDIGAKAGIAVKFQSDSDVAETEDVLTVNTCKDTSTNDTTKEPCAQRLFLTGNLVKEVDFTEGMTSIISDRVGRYLDGVTGADAYTFTSDITEGQDAPSLPTTLSCDVLTCVTYDVPEPSTWLLLGSGLIVLLGCTWRQRIQGSRLGLARSPFHRAQRR